MRHLPQTYAKITQTIRSRLDNSAALLPRKLTSLSHILYRTTTPEEHAYMLGLIAPHACEILETEKDGRTITFLVLAEPVPGPGKLKLEAIELPLPRAKEPFGCGWHKLVFLHPTDDAREGGLGPERLELVRGRSYRDICRNGVGSRAA